jgi:lysophospholipase L1-like esterase
MIAVFLMLCVSPLWAEEPKRLLFIGDSITQSGHYVTLIDAYLFAHKPKAQYLVINIGLSSETVCGLSEPNHPGARPNVNDRLAVALEKIKPHAVSVCYGMNDGIYHPFAEERFVAYQKGMRDGVIARCEAAGAKVAVLTPFPFDAVPIASKVVPASAKEFGYKAQYEKYDSEVLRKYSDWLLTLQTPERKVIDIHAALTNYVKERRKEQPTFTIATDGVHPNAEGHREAARTILKAYYPDEAAQVDAFLVSVETTRKEWFAQVKARANLLATSWRDETRGKKPKISVEEAMQKAAELEQHIRGK